MIETIYRSDRMLKTCREIEGDRIMKTRILYSKPVVEKIKDKIKSKVIAIRAQGKRAPCLAAVLVGDVVSSSIYVNKKASLAREVGMESKIIRLPNNVSQEELIREIYYLNQDDTIDGFIVQLPLPSHIDSNNVIESIYPAKDVDGFHPYNIGRLWLGNFSLVPATPSGIIDLLYYYDIPIEGRHVVIVGRSNIVGKPMAALMLKENATVTVCHSRTVNLSSITRKADILVVAVGKPGFISSEHVKEGAVVIDVGIHRIEDRELAFEVADGDVDKLQKFNEKGSILVGDCKFYDLLDKVSAITPVPGGVGPLTVVSLIKNTLTAYCNREKIENTNLTFVNC